jgi:hypothetical protein
VSRELDGKLYAGHETFDWLLAVISHVMAAEVGRASVQRQQRITWPQQAAAQLSWYRTLHTTSSATALAFEITNVTVHQQLHCTSLAGLPVHVQPTLLQQGCSRCLSCTHACAVPAEKLQEG